MSTPALKPRPSARRITTWVLGSRPAAVIASPSSNQPSGRDRVDRRVVDGDRDDARFDRLGGDRHLVLLRGRLPKQALAWYASTVTDAADSAGRASTCGLSRPGRPGDRRRARRRRRHQRGLRRAGRHRRDVRAPAGRGICRTSSTPATFATTIGRTRSSTRSSRSTAASTSSSTTRAGRPTCSPPRRRRSSARKIVELNLLGPLSVSTHANAVMQTAGARRVDRQHRQRQRPAADAGHRARTARRRRAWRTSPAHWPSNGRPRCG